MKLDDDIKRFMRHCTRRKRCVLWAGASTRGYGTFEVDGKTYRASRWIYERLCGKIPRGWDLHHLCFNPRCVRPLHLKPIKHSQHMKLHARVLTWCGQRNSQSKYTDELVMAYRFCTRLGIPKPDIARAINVPYRSFMYMVNGEGWTHLPNPKTYQEWEKVLFD
jgi:hypothetical protein